MTDCYRILGVTRQASAADLRIAYLTKMKALHPDARRDGNPSGGEAAELNFAYWQLRDDERRADHDRLLMAGSAPPPPRRRVEAGRSKRVVLEKRRTPATIKPATVIGKASSRPRRSRRLQPLRVAAGVAAGLVAGIGFAVAYSYFDPQAEAQSHTASALETRDRQSARPARRNLDPALATAAAQSFQETVRRTGLEGAHHYARQCLLELMAHPTMSMLDYCIAFDDRAASWEEAQRDEAHGRRYFAQVQRFGRYQSVARELKAGAVREAIRADAEFFANSR